MNLGGRKEGAVKTPDYGLANWRRGGAYPSPKSPSIFCFEIADLSRLCTAPPYKPISFIKTGGRLLSDKQADDYSRPKLQD